jgi:hypothetical protein
LVLLNHLWNAAHTVVSVQQAMSDRPPETSDGSQEDVEHGEWTFWEEDEDRIKRFEDRTSRYLVELVEGLAPHLVQSFICMRSWWEERKGLPEAHVRFIFIASLSDLTKWGFFRCSSTCFTELSGRE